MAEANLPIPGRKSFEELKQHNQYGAEYWTARDLQPQLGYDQWRRFENAIKKAMTSCRQSGNDPSHHFAGAGKMVVRIISRLFACNPGRVAFFTVYMMTAVDTFEFPSVFFQQSGEILTGDRFHTATSSTRSLPVIGMFETSTDRAESTAS